MVALELPQSLLVAVARLAVVLVEVLKEAQPGWAAPRRLYLPGEEEGVPAMEQPAVRGVEGDSAVAGRVSGERDQRDLGIEVREQADALEPEPAVSSRAV